jgi:hypothetical protein
MVNFNLVVGRVTAVVNTERADLLIVEDRSNPTYPQKVACEFYGDRNRKLLEGVGQGELVRVSGSARSREHQGRWYTTWSAYGIAKLEQSDSDPHGHDTNADIF